MNLNMMKSKISLHKRRVPLYTLALAGLFALQAAPALAYEEDTHFMMTLIQCRAVGLTDAEALTVASYDQGMDDSAE